MLGSLHRQQKFVERIMVSAIRKNERIMVSALCSGV